MSLEVGIVGLPNAGKSTLFNALASRRLSDTAPRPFTTIDPHQAVVPVPDENLALLSKMVNPEITVSATVTFIDIAGLVKGAHKGEGLGNQFLAKIREVDALVHVVRAFEDDRVSHPHASHQPGTAEQILEDIGIVNLELELGDIKGKPVIYVLNVGEEELGLDKKVTDVKGKFGGEVLSLSAKLEEEFIDLEKEEKEEFLKELGIGESGLERLIRSAYSLLDLITFYTIKGGLEVSAWSIRRGSSSLEAAAAVHTDFAKNFVKAEVIDIAEFLEIGDWQKAKEKGKVRLEGRDYEVRDGDVIEFKAAV
ncbi:MAG TPA: YchF family ATPase [candidate division WWE3 bacterium]|uniref:YchF family ATPase n=1 Tax=candidate division WWE3 bacterium TaxID=2053526 RepID=A0A7C1P617_UNCKA|nr:YchF family ATPase [candidate division WWE3 bacterium]